MTQRARQLLMEALELPQRARLELAASLVESAKPATDVEQAWTDELRRRLADLDSGKVVGVPWRSALEAIDAKVRRHGRRARQ